VEAWADGDSVGRDARVAAVRREGGRTGGGKAASWMPLTPRGTSTAGDSPLLRRLRCPERVGLHRFGGSQRVMARPGLCDPGSRPCDGFPAGASGCRPRDWRSSSQGRGSARVTRSTVFSGERQFIQLPRGLRPPSRVPAAREQRDPTLVTSIAQPPTPSHEAAATVARKTPCQGTEEPPGRVVGSDLDAAAGGPLVGPGGGRFDGDLGPGRAGWVRDIPATAGTSGRPPGSVITMGDGRTASGVYRAGIRERASTRDPARPAGPDPAQADGPASHVRGGPRPSRKATRGARTLWRGPAGRRGPWTRRNVGWRGHVTRRQKAGQGGRGSGARAQSGPEGHARRRLDQGTKSGGLPRGGRRCPGSRGRGGPGRRPGRASMHRVSPARHSTVGLGRQANVAPADASTAWQVGFQRQPAAVDPGRSRTSVGCRSPRASHTGTARESAEGRRPG